MTHVTESFAWCMLQVTCFSLAAAVGYLIVRRHTPSSFGRLLVISLTTIGLLTLWSMSPWPRWNWSRETSKAHNLAAVDFAAPEFLEKDTQPHDAAMQFAESLDDASTVKPASRVESSSRPRWFALVVTAWIASAVGCIRLFVGMLYTWQYRRDAAVIDDSQIGQLFDELRAGYGLNRPVALLESPQLGVAATIGWWRPTILLPASWRDWSSDERRAILAHELAHVRQRHFPAWLVAQCAVVAHFYHPLVHWLARRLRLEQEIAADYLAARVFGDRQRYAATLAGLALGPTPGATAFASLGLFMSRPYLMRRIAMLRQSGSTSGSRGLRAFVMLGLVVAAIGAVGLRATREASAEPSDAASAPVSPAAAPNAVAKSERKYRTVTALLQVSREPVSLTGEQSPSMSDTAWKVFCNTQVALLKSSVVMQAALRSPAIAALPIVKAQANPAIWLGQSISAGFYPNTEILFVELNGPTDDSEQVAKLVDAVVQAYLSEIVNADRQSRLNARDMVAKSCAKLNEELARKTEEYYDIAKEVGAAGHSASAQVGRDLAIKQFDRIDTELMRLEDEQLQSPGSAKADYYKKRIEQLTERRAELFKAIQNQSADSVTLALRKSEIDRLQKMVDGLGLKVEVMDVDAAAPDRIRKIQPATASGDYTLSHE